MWSRLSILGSFLACLCLGPSLTGCGRSDAIVVITLHPEKPDILYVATNDYIFKSRDGGETWENISRGLTHSRVISMAIDPAYPATIYAGTKGDAVFKSHDGGQRWKSLRAGLDSAIISSVVNQFVFDPANPQHIFTATTMGIYETEDGGDSWYKRMDGMKEVLMVVSLTLDPTRPPIMYAGTSGGVYKSKNWGRWWDKANNGLVPPEMIKSSRALNVTAIQVDPHEPDTVYAATLDGLYKSTDAADAWTRMGAELPDQMISAMLVDYSRPGHLYLATRKGVFVSDDRGRRWRPINEGLESLNIRSLAQSRIDPNLIYAGTNGSGLYRSTDAGQTWVSMPPVVDRKKKTQPMAVLPSRLPSFS
ncbi:MAG: WD40/YVTN/BNR-like repeat-containing protein [Nitrospirales bacterium]